MLAYALTCDNPESSSGYGRCATRSRRSTTVLTCDNAPTCNSTWISWAAYGQASPLEPGAGVADQRADRGRLDANKRRRRTSGPRCRASTAAAPEPGDPGANGLSPRPGPTDVAAGQTRQCERPSCASGLQQSERRGCVLGPGSQSSVGLGCDRAADVDCQAVLLLPQGATGANRGSQRVQIPSDRPRLA